MGSEVILGAALVGVGAYASYLTYRVSYLKSVNRGMEQLILAIAEGEIEVKTFRAQLDAEE